MNNSNKKRIILLLIPFLIFGWLGNKLSYAYYASGKDLAVFFLNLGDVFTNPLPSFRPTDLMLGAATGGIMLLLMYFKRKNAKKFRHGEEYGSAAWGTQEDIKPYD